MMHKSKIEKRLPEPQHSKEQKADGTSVSPAIANPMLYAAKTKYTRSNLKTKF